MSESSMIPKDFSTAVKDIKLAILRAWAPCSEIRYSTSNESCHSASDEIRQIAFMDV